MKKKVTKKVAKKPVAKKKPVSKKVTTKKPVAKKKPAAKKPIVENVVKKKSVTKKKSVSADVQRSIDRVFPQHTPDQPAMLPALRKSKMRQIFRMHKPFDVYCACVIIEKIVEYKKGELARKFKGDAWDLFYDMLKQGEHPDTFNGQFQDAQTSHAEASALFTCKTKQGEISEPLAEELEKHGIPYQKIVIVPEKGYRLNPNLFGTKADQEILGKIAKAIEGIEGIDPEEVFIPTDPISNSFMSDQTLPSIMAVSDEKTRVKLLKKVTSLQISHATLGDETWNSEKAKEAALEILEAAGVL